MIEQRDPAQTFDGPAPLRLGISIPSGELSPSPSHSVDRTIRRANPKKMWDQNIRAPFFCLCLCLLEWNMNPSTHCSAAQHSTAQQTLISCKYVRMRNPEVVHSESASFDV